MQMRPSDRNDALKAALLNECYLLIDRTDVKRRYLYNIADDVLLDWDPEILEQVLSFTEYELFVADNKLIYVGVVLNPAHPFVLSAPEIGIHFPTLNLYKGWDTSDG